MFRILTLMLALCLTLPAHAQEPGPEERAALELYNAGKTDEAIAAFAIVLKANPKNLNAAGAIAQLYINKGDYQAAYATATAGLKISGDAAFLYIAAATAALKMDKPDDALRLMDDVLKKYPTQDYAFYVRGMALDAKGQIQQAIGAYSKSIQLKPDFPDVYYNRGADFYAISRYGDALKDFNKLLELNDSWSIGYNKRGLTHYALGNLDLAIADYTRCIALQPASAIPYANRGLAYLDKGQIGPAKADFEKAIALEPGYAEGYYGLARACNDEHAYSSALPAVEKAISLNTKMPAYFATYCATLIGLNRDKEAIAVADKILAIDDHNPDGWMYKASAQSNTSDLTAAIATMNAAIGKVPENYLLYALRAGIYRRQGNVAAADADDATAKSLGVR